MNINGRIRKEFVATCSSAVGSLDPWNLGPWTLGHLACALENIVTNVLCAHIFAHSSVHYNVRIYAFIALFIDPCIPASNISFLHHRIVHVSIHKIICLFIQICYMLRATHFNPESFFHIICSAAYHVTSSVIPYVSFAKVLVETKGDVVKVQEPSHFEKAAANVFPFCPFAFHMDAIDLCWKDICIKEVNMPPGRTHANKY